MTKTTRVNKAIIKGIIIIIIAMTTLITTKANACEIDNKRITKATVSYYEKVEEPTYTEYKIHLITEDGNEWIYNKRKPMSTNTKVLVIFDTMGTDTIEDDCIIKIKKTR